MSATEAENRSAPGKNITFWQNFRCNTCSMVAHAVIVLFTGFVLYTAQPGSSLFSWHPTLMVVAFALLMTESILVYSPLSSLIVKASRKTKVTVHWVGMLAALLCACVGAFVIWYNKELHKKAHATSWHGTMGYVTLAYAAIECCGGIVVKYPELVKGWVRPADLKLYHATAALILFCVACVTLVLAMYSEYFVGRVTGTSWYMCMACPSILALAVMNQITTSFAHRISPSGRRATQGKEASS